MSLSRAPGQQNRLRDSAVLANKKRVIKMLMVVVITFCLLWLPYQVETNNKHAHVHVPIAAHILAPIFVRPPICYDT